jgi:Heavy metal binding domain
MKRIVVLLAPLLMLIAAVALAHEGHEHGKSPGKTVTLTGEVIDMTCFLQHPASATGAEHAKCAKMCINKGLPIGFLADNGTVYNLIGDDHEPIAAKVVERAGARSTITGVIVEQHGVKGFELVSIGAAVSGAKTAAQPGGMPGTAPADKPSTAPAEKPSTAPANKPASASAVTYYTCAMHPEVHMTQPGVCPKCGMTLIPEKKK